MNDAPSRFPANPTIMRTLSKARPEQLLGGIPTPAAFGVMYSQCGHVPKSTCTTIMRTLSYEQALNVDAFESQMDIGVREYFHTYIATSCQWLRALNRKFQLLTSTGPLRYVI